MAKRIPRLCVFCGNPVTLDTGGWVVRGRREVFAHIRCANPLPKKEKHPMIAALPYILYCVGSLCFLAGSVMVLLRTGR